MDLCTSISYQVFVGILIGGQTEHNPFYGIHYISDFAHILQFMKLYSITCYEPPQRIELLKLVHLGCFRINKKGKL